MSRNKLYKTTNYNIDHTSKLLVLHAIQVAWFTLNNPYTYNMNN